MMGPLFQWNNLLAMNNSQPQSFSALHLLEEAHSDRCEVELVWYAILFLSGAQCSQLDHLNMTIVRLIVRLIYLLY